MMSLIALKQRYEKESYYPNKTVTFFYYNSDKISIITNLSCNESKCSFNAI